MLALRPVQLTDLPQLQQLARDSLVGVTSLPDDTARLEEKILDSCASFEADVQAPGAQTYFCLGGPGGRAPGRLFGNSFQHRLQRTVLQPAQPTVFQRIPGAEHPAWRARAVVVPGPQRTDAAAWLPHRRRTGAHAGIGVAVPGPADVHRRPPQRFAESVITEIVGFSSEDGQSPFWDAIGQHFFDLPYVEAERLCGLQSRTFLAELMPQYPIYVPMLPPAAQACIGRVHPDGQEAFDILEREGFETNSYVDIFDGGPTLHARVAHIHSITQSRIATARQSRQIDAKAVTW